VQVHPGTRDHRAWFQRLKLNCDEALSNFTFRFNLRRFTKVVNGPEIMSKFLGESEQKMRELFRDAEEDLAVGTCNL